MLVSGSDSNEHVQPATLISERPAPQRVRQRELTLPLLADLQAGIDALIIFLTGVIAKLAYLDGYLQSKQPTATFAVIGLIVAACATIVFRNLELYGPRTLLSPTMRVGRIFVGLAASFLIVLAMLYLLKVGQHFSRGWMTTWFIACALSIVIGRSIVRLYARLLVAEGRARQRVAVLGTGDLARDVARSLAARTQEVEVVGVFEDEASGSNGGKGGLSALVELSRNESLDRVVVAMPVDRRTRLAEAASALEALPVAVEYCPERIDLPIRADACRRLGDLLLFELQQRPLSERGLLIKSVTDYVLSLLLLLLLAPVMGLIAVAIKLDSKGPVFFRQQRHGYNNSVIRIWKFRTMTVMEDGPQIAQAQRNDPRITRVGRFLRRLSLDELPQLFNVLSGQMSLVGPRPHAVAHGELYAKVLQRYAVRHRVKPGITGWAQVNGYRGETSDPVMMQRRVEHDLFYIDNWSVWLDIEILVRTAVMVVIGRNAY